MAPARDVSVLRSILLMVINWLSAERVYHPDMTPGGEREGGGRERGREGGEREGGRVKRMRQTKTERERVGEKGVCVKFYRQTKSESSLTKT